MARATINQGANEAAVVAATNAMLKGNLFAINYVPAASQLETQLRYLDRAPAEARVDIVVTPPLAQ